MIFCRPPDDLGEYFDEYIVLEKLPVYSTRRRNKGSTPSRDYSHDNGITAKYLMPQTHREAPNIISKNPGSIALQKNVSP